MSNKLEINKRQGQIIDCACRECRRTTKHEIVVEATLSGSTGPGGFEINWASEHQVVKCLGCETLSFRRADGNDHDSYVQIGDDEWEYQPHESLYPSPHDGRQPVSDVDMLPEKIQRIYVETLGALNNSQEVLCGIGVRAIIETVCKD